MPRKTANQQDKYDDLLLDTIRGMDKKVDKLTNNLEQNTLETQRINSGLKQAKIEIAHLNDKVFPITPTTIKDLPPIWQNRQLILLGTFFFGFLFIIVLLVATAKGIKIPGIN